MTTTFDVFQRHQVYLEGFKLGTAMTFRAGYLPDIEGDIARVFAVVKDASMSDLTKVRQAALVNQVTTLLRRRMNAYKADMLAFLYKYMVAERTMFGDMTPETSVPAKPLYGPQASADDRTGRNRLWSLVVASTLPGVGSTLIGSFNVFTESVVSNAANIIRRAVVNNLSPQETLEAFTGTQSALFGNALMRRVENQNIALIATMIQHVAQMVSAAVASVWHSNYTYAATLDANTTDICAQRNGVVYTFGDGPLPPAHYRCRAFIVPGSVKLPLNFSVWLDSQPEGIVKDMFTNRDGQRMPKPISLDDFVEKMERIVA